MATPSDAELVKIGVELIETLRPLREKYPGLDVTICYTMPRPNTDAHAASVVSTMGSGHVLELLEHVAKGVKKQHAGTPG